MLLEGEDRVPPSQSSVIPPAIHPHPQGPWLRLHKAPKERSGGVPGQRQQDHFPKMCP